VKFREWLQEQQEREDNIGVLARALDGKEGRPRSKKRRWDEHRHWVNIVTRMNMPRLNYVFNTAWQEYLEDKELAEDEGD
jgi:hypothetical protein